jgi:hypothetical protein
VKLEHLIDRSGQGETGAPCGRAAPPDLPAGTECDDFHVWRYADDANLVIRTRRDDTRDPGAVNIVAVAIVIWIAANKVA